VHTHREGNQQFGAVEVRTDLKITRAHCVRLQTEELDTQLRHALWEGAVMAYGRCFRGGAPGIKTRPRQAREPVPADVLSELTFGQQVTHRTILDFRDKFVGHRVTNKGLHHVRVDALTSSLDGNGDVCGVHVEDYNLNPAISKTAMLAVEQLAEALIAALESAITIYQDRLIEELRADEGWRVARQQR